MDYSRTNPSARYTELQAIYKQIHEDGEKARNIPPAKTFPGFSLDAHMMRIKNLIDETQASTVLDYGCGKGQQYWPRKIGGELTSVLDLWGVDEIACYDPCYQPFNKLPDGKFDGVISTDVLEHCPEDDISWILDEIFGYADRFVFLNISGRPAFTHLPNGENAHCTVRSGAWWHEAISRVAQRHMNIKWDGWIEFGLDINNKLDERNLREFSPR